MINHKHYTYTVMWSEEDAEYVGLCAELPSVSFLHSKQDKALAGIINTVRIIIKDMRAHHEKLPEHKFVNYPSEESEHTAFG